MGVSSAAFFSLLVKKEGLTANGGVTPKLANAAQRRQA